MRDKNTSSKRTTRREDDILERYILIPNKRIENVRNYRFDVTLATFTKYRYCLFVNNNARTFMREIIEM